MIVKQSEFVTSVAHLSQLPDGELPEIALAGRSNVGKSTLINRMLGRKALAKTSSTPGKTRMLNYFLINESLYFVDCPGYGYAKVGHAELKQWGGLIETYLLQRSQLKLVLHLVDVRHKPNADDVAMFEWLMHHELPVCVVVTKSDKIPRSKWAQHVKVIRDTLGKPAHVPLVLFSSETGAGRDELWEHIERALPLDEERLAGE